MWFVTTEAAFLEHVQSGGVVESGDPMPDEYRALLVKFIAMHGNSELMGVLPERDWILRAPTLQRKLALTAKVQDEVGHAQLIYRVCEDLGAPREQLLEDLLGGVVPHPPRPRRHPGDDERHPGAARACAGGRHPLVGADHAVPRHAD